MKNAPSELVQVDAESLEEGLAPSEVVQAQLELVAALESEHLCEVISRFEEEHSGCCRRTVELVLELEER